MKQSVSPGRHSADGLLISPGPTSLPHAQALPLNVTPQVQSACKLAGFSVWVSHVLPAAEHALGVK